MRTIPNPKSQLLAGAIVGGVGLTAPRNATPPEGMGLVLLYVPLEELADKNPLDIQADLGLPWFCHNGPPMWLDELGEKSQKAG